MMKEIDGALTVAFLRLKRSLSNLKASIDIDLTKECIGFRCWTICQAFKLQGILICISTTSHNEILQKKKKELTR